jgi:hypothetical protein
MKRIDGASIGALLVGVTTLVITFGPLLGISPWLPALFIVVVGGALVSDQFLFQSRHIRLLLGLLQELTPEHKSRVLHHEAGHFLVSHLVGIKIVDYSLDAWDIYKKGDMGSGGVVPDQESILTYTQKAPWSKVEQYCMAMMAGPAAEQRVFDSVWGGSDDLEKVRLCLAQAKKNPDLYRLYVTRAHDLLESHQAIYEQLVALMAKKTPVEECLAFLDAPLIPLSQRPGG